LFHPARMISVFGILLAGFCAAQETLPTAQGRVGGQPGQSPAIQEESIQEQKDTTPPKKNAAGEPVVKFGWAMGRDALTNVFREYWPDIAVHVLHRHP
jgi:hypothetical protein